jgi:uncharacterized membrane protein
MLLFIPLTILFVPIIAFEFCRSKIINTKFEFPNYTKDWDGAVVYFIGLWCVLCMLVFMWFHIPTPQQWRTGGWNGIFGVGFTCWCFVIVIALTFLVVSIQKKLSKKKRLQRHYYKQNTPNFFIVAYKAFKEKHCPKINIVD